MGESGSDVVVVALYHFAPMEALKELQVRLLEQCTRAEIQGTLLLAGEGINGTIAGDDDGVETVLAFLRAQPGLGNLEHKRSFCSRNPFHRMKVRLKREIVTMGDDEIDPTRRVGTYVDPTDWNEIISDPEVIVVDTRNDYEVRIGTFDGAVDPGLVSFREFPEWAKTHLDPQRTPKVAMFCTGGIRCEKASSLLLREGFSEVLHLRGGILAYLAETEEVDSMWNGECFVFDQRVALDADLKPGEHRLCFGCQEPVSKKERESSNYEEGVTCPRCHTRTSDEERRQRRERVQQVERARARGERHIGGPMPGRVSC